MSTLTDDSPIVVTDPTFEEGGDEDNLVHVACECSDDLALCGAELTMDAGDFTDDEVCVVCHDLEPLPCPRCGMAP